VETLGWRFEVVDMDGRRVDKVLAQRIGSRTAALEGATTADGHFPELKAEALS
jgi:hypothetical protein